MRDSYRDETRSSRAKPRLGGAIVALLVAAGLIAVTAVMTSSSGDTEAAGTAVADSPSTTQAPPSSGHPSDRETSLDAMRRDAAAAPGAVGADLTSIAVVDGLPTVRTAAFGELTPIMGKSGLLGYVLADAARHPDPQASIRNCVKAAGENQELLCGDLREAIDSGRTWAVPLDAESTFFGLGIMPPLSSGIDSDVLVGYVTPAGILPIESVTPQLIEDLKACGGSRCADIVRALHE